MTLLTAPIRAARGRRFILHDISWEFYESMLKELGDRHVFLSYYKGTLELMSPAYPHDRCSRLLLFFLVALAETFAVPLHSIGTTTLRRKRYKIGLEADEAFYTYKSGKIRTRNRKTINLEVDPPPDLAIEVEMSRRLGAREKIYARLGIPEVWKYNGARLVISLLDKESCKYQAVEISPTFPHVSPAEITDWVRRGISRDDAQWLKDVREWLTERAESVRR